MVCIPSLNSGEASTPESQLWGPSALFVDLFRLCIMTAGMGLVPGPTNFVICAPDPTTQSLLKLQKAR